jgi:hypothetical protein
MFMALEPEPSAKRSVRAGCPPSLSPMSDVSLINAQDTGYYSGCQIDSILPAARRRKSNHNGVFNNNHGARFPHAEQDAYASVVGDYEDAMPATLVQEDSKAVKLEFSRDCTEICFGMVCLCGSRSCICSLNAPSSPNQGLLSSIPRL